MASDWLAALLAANQKLHLKIVVSYPCFYPRIALVTLTPVLQYALLIDEINTEITKKNLATYVGSLDEKQAAYYQLMLKITNAIAGRYHIGFGEEKNNVMKIGRSKNNPEFTLRDVNLKYTDKYKYLGYIQNNKNNLEDHIKALRGEVENGYKNPTSHSRKQ